MYHQPEIQRVLANGVRWAAPTQPRHNVTAIHKPDQGWFDA